MPSPEVSSANLKKTSAFQDWRRGRFLVEERWVELPEVGLRVGYFVVPGPWTRDRVEQPRFHDAFFVLDARTGQLVAPALVRTSLPLNGCPKMGEVAQLVPEPESKASAALRFGNGLQSARSRRRARQTSRARHPWDADTPFRRSRRWQRTDGREGVARTAT